MGELRECPFCGSDAAQVVCDIADWPSVVCSVHEGGCGASSGHCSSGGRDEAVSAWNRRAYGPCEDGSDLAPYFDQPIPYTVTEAGKAAAQEDKDKGRAMLAGEG